MAAPHRDDAAIRITENGQATIHYLGSKLRRPHAPRKPERSWTFESPDFSTRRTVTIASTARDLRAQLRYEGQPHQLEDMLAAGMRGAAMEYFPSISNPSEVYPFDLIEHSDVSPDPSRWFEHRYSVADVLLRRRDGGTWDGVLSGSLFYWLAGNDLPGLTFTRSSTATYVDEDGTIQSAATDIFRTSWPLINGVRVPVTPLEALRDNELDDSSDFETATTAWGLDGALTEDGAATSIIQGESARQFTGPNPTENDRIRQDQGTFTGSPETFWAILENVDADESAIGIRDTTGTDLTRGRITWATEVADLQTDDTGTGSVRLRKLSDFGPNGGVVYRLEITGTYTGGNNRRVEIEPAGQTTAGGTCIVHHAQLEEASFGSSAIVSSTGPTTRNGGTMFSDIDFTPDGIKANGGATLYFRFIERGTSLLGANARLWHIGSATVGDDPRISCRISAGGSHYGVVHDNGVEAVVADLSESPSLFDQTEVRVVIHDDGHVTIGQRIDGAAETTAEDPTAIGLGGDWAGTRLYFNSGGSTLRGMNEFRDAKGIYGVKSMDEMAAL